MSELISVSRQQLIDAVANAGSAFENGRHALEQPRTYVDGASVNGSDELFAIYRHTPSAMAQKGHVQGRSTASICSTLEEQSPHQSRLSVSKPPTTLFSSVVGRSTDPTLDPHDPSSRDAEMHRRSQDYRHCRVLRVTQRDVPPRYTGRAHSVPAVYQLGDRVPTSAPYVIRKPFRTTATSTTSPR